ncbi:MAG: ferritin-like domain-containing protein [Alphaproteobacteria bacterium]|nr:ferritin-like domain-containing protein [Alphaproteobacteria bacterium]MCB9796251.1 ferritin-like domain-containing protein [Alphaproteobacteria bacterium]
MSPMLRALSASLIASIALSAGCIGGSDDKVDSLPDSSTDDSGATSACEGATPLNDSRGQPSGFEQCADGTINRVRTVTADATINDPTCAGDEDYLDCQTDADCTAQPHGVCRSGTTEPEGGTYCGCVYSCETDADCGEGRICLPHGVVDTWTSYSVCIPAECETNADCDSGECALTAFNDGCGPAPQLTCRTPDDACRVDADCASVNNGECAPDYEGNWACRVEECAIGRPLLVEGEARRAAAAPRGDWASDLAPLLPEDPALRARLAGWWREVAALEHASVASFARFTLQLMALGAPPELLAETQVAAADEVLHAKLAFGLASAYAGAPVGPGPLALGDLGVATDRVEVTRALVAEACVGETLGVAEALASAEACADPVVREALTRIAEDERRHAALAWRTLRWLISQDAELIEVAEQAMQSALDHHLAEVAPSPGAPAFGMLGERERLSLRRAAARAVVRPCFEAAVA